MRFLITSLTLALAAALMAQQGGPHRDRGGKGDFDKALDRADLPPIIRTMARNLPTWKYSGTRVIEIRDGAQRKLTREFVLRDGVKSRTWFPDDSPRAGEVIVEDGRQRKFYDPRKNVILVTRMGKGGRGGPDRLFQILGKNFKFADEKADKVAGHDSRVVSVTDPQGRVFQRVWIDSRFGVPLRRELYDNVGARQGFSEFREINFSPILRPGDFDIKVPGAKIVTPYDIAKEIGAKLGITPVLLPRDRFSLENAMTMPSKAGSWLHTSYSMEDGFVSLFQAKGKVELDRLPQDRRTNVFTWSDNGNSFVLIGRGPKDRLQNLARELGMK